MTVNDSSQEPCLDQSDWDSNPVTIRRAWFVQLNSEFYVRIGSISGVLSGLVYVFRLLSRTEAGNAANAALSMNEFLI